MHTDQYRPAPPNLLANACIILVRTEGPVNLGMVARLCGNLGCADLRLVAPITAIDCEDARKFSTHSRELLLSAPVYPDLASAVADCGLVVGTSARFRHKEFGMGVRVQEVPRLLAERPAARWALVFGNEADGLSEDELRRCQAWVHLDTPGPNSAYNLAMSVAITGYSIACMDAAEPTAQPEAASREHVAALYTYWLETLDRFQYFRRTDRARFEPLFERFLNRQHLSVLDVQTFRGMLSQFNYFAFGGRFDRQERDTPAQDGAAG
jgi:TrmH family RNA methyltransferase